ncbi:MAG TPA: hypothetical protein VEW03_07550, partial [Longimicrobiaceae bacterium]|nr:hypothetical protein [Longimicrobiaceae bacterium]
MYSITHPLYPHPAGPKARGNLLPHRFPVTAHIAEGHVRRQASAVASDDSDGRIQQVQLHERRLLSVDGNLVPSISQEPPFQSLKRPVVIGVPISGS